MKLTKAELLSRGFIEVPCYASMEALQKDGLKLAKRVDLKNWRCLISENWHDIKTTEQLDLLLKIVNNE